MHGNPSSSMPLEANFSNSIWRSADTAVMPASALSFPSTMSHELPQAGLCCYRILSSEVWWYHKQTRVDFQPFLSYLDMRHYEIIIFCKYKMKLLPYLAKHKKYSIFIFVNISKSKRNHKAIIFDFSKLNTISLILEVCWALLCERSIRL